MKFTLLSRIRINKLRAQENVIILKYNSNKVHYIHRMIKGLRPNVSAYHASATVSFFKKKSV